MKLIIVAVLLFVGRVQAASPDTLKPRNALQADGSLTLTDGSSYFIFAQDGTFQSFPAGLSGRTFEGTWTAKDEGPTIFTVEAKQGWINGVSRTDDYRKIVFFIYSGHKRAVETQPFGGTLPSKEVWDGYFLIDELTRIPKPAK
jgi:hypothetical protein